MFSNVLKYSFSRSSTIKFCNCVKISTDLLPSKKNAIQIFRFKSTTSKKKQSSSESGRESDGSEFLDQYQDKNTKIAKVNLSSMRLDAVLKGGLGLSRNKIEVIFYESKIRLNGEKVLKKSAHIQNGDEIDVIKGVSTSNPDFLTVARVELLSAEPKEDTILAKIRRSKTLTIENYSGKNSWQS